ncbi:glycoside hydrolase family 25 protein [Nonomuraea sp. WAC 01424]|uniref:glycoside hydrolase family 25 protein n=1 Tax=Nonomuraea sp. WAC 01424 TaxID=2203200 RepID=UPI000F784388|nr:GH25 family lysozyme [Nonomuraea sp. WAC 01424]
MQPNVKKLLAGALLAATAAAPALGLASTAAPAQASTAVQATVHADGLTYGQDVSHYQPDHDWAASGAAFGIVKATEGATRVDASFARHWADLGAKGKVRGAYHYGHPSNDAIAEADHFLSVVNRQPAAKGDLLALDLETTDGRSVTEVNAWARTWLAHVQAKTGITPLFYSGWNFADEYGRGLQQYPLWVARYGVGPGSVTAPADWKSWTIHQYADAPVDQNVSALTAAQLKGLGRR